MSIADYNQSMEEYVSVMGAPMEELIFPAMITGVAKPQFVARDYPNCRLVDPQPPCEDSPEYIDCSGADVPDANGFFPESFLPCGVWPVRYRWRAEIGGASSEVCGRRIVNEIWKPWKQTHYAVNTAHVTQDPELNYPYLRPGTLVIMQFSDLTLLPLMAGGPRYGFSFHHMTDPLGTIAICPEPGTSTRMGCCYYYVWDDNLGDWLPVWSCLPEDQCFVLHESDWTLSENCDPLTNCPVPGPGQRMGCCKHWVWDPGLGDMIPHWECLKQDDCLALVNPEWTLLENCDAQNCHE